MLVLAMVAVVRMIERFLLNPLIAVTFFNHSVAVLLQIGACSVRMYILKTWVGASQAFVYTYYGCMGWTEESMGAG